MYICRERENLMYIYIYNASNNIKNKWNMSVCVCVWLIEQGHSCQGRKTVQPPRGCANLCSIRCTMVVWAGPWLSQEAKLFTGDRGFGQ